MDRLLDILIEIGFPPHEVERISNYYKDDLSGLTHYVTFVRAMFDDRREYI